MFTTQGFSNLLNLARIAFQKKRKKSQYILYPIALILQNIVGILLKKKKKEKFKYKWVYECIHIKVYIYFL